MQTPHIMGVVNTSPDSFYADSRVHNVVEAMSVIDDMVKQGATIIDIGGEATNPMLDVSVVQVSLQEELDRILTVIDAAQQRFDVLLSVDTSKPEVMTAAIKAGAGMINDQRALTRARAIDTAAQLDVPVCLMHMYGLNVRTLNGQAYRQTLQEIKDYLLQRADECTQHGIKPQHIIIDPGFGYGNYGKSTQENLYLLKHIDEFVASGYDVCVGFSRKTMIGDVLNLPVEERLHGGLALAVLAAIKGVGIIRTHDVAATVQAVNMAMSVVNIRDKYRNTQ